MNEKGTLKQFDLVAAITQNTINGQLKLLSATGVLPQNWEAAGHPKDLEAPPKLSAMLGVPRVNMVTGDATSRKLELVLPIVSGQFDYWKLNYGRNGHPTSHPTSASMNGTELRLKINLDLAGIGAKLTSENKSIPENVKKQLTEFHDSMFKIDHLFLNFEDANLIESFEMTNDWNPDMNDPVVVGQFKSMLTGLISRLQGMENPFILGYTITGQSGDSNKKVSSFAPTGSNFSVFPEPSFISLSTLNFLLMTDHKPVPTEGDAGIFTENWVEKSNVQGTFAVCQNLIVNPIFPLIAKSIGGKADAFKRKNNAFSLYAQNSIEGINSCTLRPNSNTNQLFADFICTYSQKVKDHAGSIIGSVSGSVKWTSTISYDLDENDEINVRIENSDKEETHEIKRNALGDLEAYLAVFADAVLKIVSFGEVENVFTSMVKDDWNINLNLNMAEAVSKLKTSFVLPAGNVFFFKCPRFNHDGDLLLDITYNN